MLTSYHPWNPEPINDALELSVVFPSDNEVNNNLYGYLHKINSIKLHLDHND